MDDPVNIEVSGGFPVWAALLLVLLAIVGVALATGQGDPVGYARATEARAAADVDITRLVTDLQRDVATMENENKRLAMALEYQERAAERAASDRFWSMALLIVSCLAAGVWSIVLFVLATNLVGDGKKRKRKRKE